MRRLGIIIATILVLGLAGFAALVNSAVHNGPPVAQIRVELQDGL